MMHQVIILGSGPAGLTAALYAARADLQPLVLEGPTPGGQLMGTSFVENWPGTLSILGAQLIMNMKEHAQKFGALFLSDTAIAINNKNSFCTITTNLQTVTTRVVILAVGAGPKQLNCPGEQDYWGKGVTTCAICDGALYRNQPVVIVGGGDTAMEDASFMARFTPNITIVHILDKLTASPAMQKRVLTNPHIKIIYNSTISAIHGNNNHVTQITIKNQKNNQETQIPTAAVFLAIGLKPKTEFLKNIVELDSYGYIKTYTPTSVTSQANIFACGDAVDYRYRQAITAAGMGCMAAIDAQRYLEKF